MNHLVIDLEMCRVPKHYRGIAYKYGYEIIQIGAVLLDEEFKEIAKLSQFVRPDHGVIDNFISDLTGIHQSQVKNAPGIREAILHMLDWLGDRQYKVYAWSDSDYKQLMHELTGKQIQDDRILEFMELDRWVNYQKVFSDRYEFNRAIGLEEALGLAKIDPKGSFHDGLWDAVNTGKLIATLELNPEYELQDYRKELEVNSEPLSFGLGSLFAGMNLQFS